MSEPAVPTVLFLCVHNAGRSQMAHGFLDHYARGRARALSGGSDPADRLNPVAVAAMAEVGVDISAHCPQRWSNEQVASADVVVVMGCGDKCPRVPGTRFEDWALADPAGLELPAVRPIRDDIAARVRALLEQLDERPPSTEGVGL